jgi:hypothetical protein
MLELLRQFNHLPRGTKDGFVALLLPELDVKITAREFTSYKPGLPLRSFFVHRWYLPYA